MNRPRQFSLASMMLITAALPCWLMFIWGVGSSPGFGAVGFVFAAFTLIVGTAAIARLFRPQPHAVGIAMLLAGILLPSVLWYIALLVAAVAG